MRKVKVWDPIIRLFHWSVVLTFVANAWAIDDESKLHQQVGWLIVALLGLRVLWGLVGTQHARFSDFPPSIPAAMHQVQDIATGRVHHHIGHSPLGAWMIYALLSGLAGLCATGVMMTTDRFWGIGWVEEIHEALMVVTAVAACVHVGAVVIESRRTGVNLPRAMITGTKVMPHDDAR